MSVTEKIECVVIGAGVVGLAVARALALQGRDVIILESENAIGTGTSSRNSEVIHAGIYYPKDSLKAKLCVLGKHMLYEYCAEHGVPHKRCGKLIVATNEVQDQTLEEIKQRAWNNGVEDLTRLDKNQVLDLEPDVNAVSALLSPSTGIIDSHSLMLAYQGDAEDRGAMIAFNSPVTSGRVGPDGIELEVGGASPMTLACEMAVNSAGLHAQILAGAIEGFPSYHVPESHYAKGNYFSLSGKTPFTHLIYPVPEEAGLGVHLTLDLGGQARFGPDVEWVDEIAYEVNPTRGDIFYDAIRSYWPALPDNSLTPGYSGIRPKLLGKGNPASDFVVQGPETHGVQGLVNLFGIESPGLTASMAIAEEVVSRLP
jgi:L-2-hydroxyglutarate oxidase LhgO